MTREEAIAVLENEARIIDDNSIEMTAREWDEFDDLKREAIPVAIEALTHECDSCIWEVCNYNKIDWNHGRLINADKLLLEVFTVDEEEWTTPEIRAILENAPKVIPTERTGEWVTEKGSYEIICSKCGCEAFSKYGEWFKSDYCHNCGAKMYKEKNNE